MSEHKEEDEAAEVAGVAAEVTGVAGVMKVGALEMILPRPPKLQALAPSIDLVAW